MKHEGQKISGAGNTVHSFLIGKEELRILEAITAHYRKAIPNTIETQTLRARIATILKEIRSVLVSGKGRRS